MIEIIKPGILIDFVSNFKKAVSLSLILILIGIGSLIMHNGPKLGIEFKGGTSIHIKFNNKINVVDLRNAIKVSPTFKNSKIQSFGNKGNEFVIYSKFSTSSTDKSMENNLRQYLTKKFGNTYKIVRVDMIGPKIGKEFRNNGIEAIILSLIAILIYISIRFQYRFAFGAILALFHDVLITVGFLSIFNYEFTLDVVAAILTLIGYSVNDTIVVFDRIREKVRNNRKLSNEEAVNLGISETLSRTILTSGTVLFVVLALFLFGGSSLKGLSFALLIGILSGTYSSIFIASPVLLLFKGKLMPEKKEKDSVDKFKERVAFDMKNIEGK